MKLTPPSLSIRAFSLAEVALALGITAFCLLAIFGLLPVGLNSDHTTHEETAAIGILSEVATDLRATPVANPPTLESPSGLFSIPIPASSTLAGGTSVTIYFDHNGRKTDLLKNDSRYRLTVTFLPNLANANSKAAMCATMKMTWPAAASPQDAPGSAAMFFALDRN